MKQKCRAKAALTRKDGRFCSIIRVPNWKGVFGI